MQQIRNAKGFPLGKALVIWMLVLIIVLLYTQGMIFGTENTLSATRSSNAGPVLDDTLLTQHLYLPEGTTALQIRLGTYERVNTALLQCTLYQEAYAQTALIPLETAEDNSYVTIPFDYDRLTEGNAVLEISGMDTGVKNFVTVYLSDETIFGQYHNGESWDDSVNLALILSYQVMPALGFRVAYAVCLVAFLAVLLLALLREEAVWAPVRMARVNYFLIASVLFGFVMTFQISTLDVYANAGHAEVITNFFHYAYTESVAESFTRLDAGYYPLLPRIIALLAVRGLGLVDYYPLVMNLLTTALGFFFISTLNLRSMRRIVASDLLRFVVCLPLIITLLQTGANFWALHNIVYPAFMLILCFFFILDKTAPPWKALLFGIVSFVLVMSKGVLIALAPVVLLHVIYCARHARRNVSFGALLILGIVLQSAVMLSSFRNSAGLATRATYALTSQGSGLIPYLFNVAIEAFTQFHARLVLTLTEGVTLTFNHVYLLCLALIVFMMVYALRQKENSYNRVMAIGMMLSALLCYAIVIITNDRTLYYERFYTQALSLIKYAINKNNRQTMLSVLAILFCVLISLQAAFKRKPALQAFAILMVLLNMVSDGVLNLQTTASYKYDQIPSWQHYTQFLSRDAFGLPIYNSHYLARDSSGAPLPQSTFRVLDAYGVPIYDKDTPREWSVWVYTKPGTRSLYMAEKASLYTSAYALPAEAREVFQRGTLSTLIFLSPADKTYHLPITLALYDDAGSLISLIPPVEDKYTRNSVYDLADLPQDRPVASIRLMQNGQYIRFSPDFALYYHAEMADDFIM